MVKLLKRVWRFFGTEAKLWFGVVIVFVLMGSTIAYQRGEIKKKNRALMEASFQLKQAATSIRVRDSVIYLRAQRGGQSIGQLEETCLAKISEAYDNGFNDARLGIVPRSLAEQQAAGAFRGSVP